MTTANIAKPDGIVTRYSNPQGKRKINGKKYRRNDYYAVYIYKQFPRVPAFNNESVVKTWIEELLFSQGCFRSADVEVHLNDRSTGRRRKVFIEGVSVYDVMVGCKSQDIADKQCDWLKDHLETRYPDCKNGCRLYRGGVKPMIAAWQFDYATTVLPNGKRMLVMS